MITRICNSDDWAVLNWHHAPRESGRVETACVQFKAFPQELQPEITSRVCRMIPLTIAGVLAPLSCAFGELRVVPRRNSFVPIGMKVYFFVIYLSEGERNNYERTT